MSLLRIFTTSFLAEGVVIIVGFINSIIITRSLGVEGRGEYSLGMTIVTILSLVFGDGLCRANTYLTSKDKRNVPSLFGNLVVYNSVMAIILLAVGLLGYPLVRLLFPGLSHTLVFISFSVVPFLMAVRSISAIFLGRQDYNRYNIFLALPFLIYLVANLLILKFGVVTSAAVLLNYTWSILIVLIAIVIQFRKQEKGFATNKQIARQSWDAGAKATVSHISLFLLFRIDIILINIFLGVGAAGLYSIAVLIAELLQKLANTSGNVIFPKITGDNQVKNRALTLKVLTFVLSISILFSLSMMFFGRDLIILLFKKDFSASAPALMWLLPGAVLMTGAKIINIALWARGFPRITVIAPLIALAVNIILNILLIPKLGLPGSAMSTSISYAIYAAILAGSYFKPGGVKQV
ncbi:MAG TPA: oligosaccharide flippase family protein [bacterium]|nr:oligosaccharide flippase family protein [bacterium]HPN45759.1 oligosaccharide flippase family protein [bacterium]